MPERPADKETLRAGEPLRIGNLTLLPIERVATHTGGGASHVWFSASKEPVALVVRDAKGVRSIGIETVLSIEQLQAQIPGLNHLIGLK